MRQISVSKGAFLSARVSNEYKRMDCERCILSTAPHVGTVVYVCISHGPSHSPMSENPRATCVWRCSVKMPPRSEAIWINCRKKRILVATVFPALGHSSCSSGRGGENGGGGIGANCPSSRSTLTLSLSLSLSGPAAAIKATGSVHASRSSPTNFTASPSCASPKWPRTMSNVADASTSSWRYSSTSTGPSIPV